ncbi:catalase family peroxidase [Sorangium sp. So ce542]|uniref:catalase family peroxidase n=1 Tax=Sorangium sp. So ce542 TaxID=3133316 RepID=UPI003F617145
MFGFLRSRGGLQGLVRAKAGEIARASLIFAIVAALAAAFAFVAGVLDPSRLTPAKVVDALEGHDGLHPGFRRAHAKGVCFTGRFEASGAGARLSRASVLARGEVPVIGRFSTGGGVPYAPDGRVALRSMALSFSLPNGEQWRTAMNHIPVFPVATPAAFLDFQRATSPVAATGKPDAARVEGFLAAHPETRAFMARLRDGDLPSSFANGTYHSVNAFRFTGGAGPARDVRWSMVPEAPLEALDKATLASRPPSFLFEEVVARLARGPLRWRMRVTLAAPGDPTGDATREWPRDREQVEVGALVVERAATEEAGPCRDITFDPLILPAGIEPSDDPLLSARSSAYAVSLTRRAGEGPAPSALSRGPAEEGARR